MAEHEPIPEIPLRLDPQTSKTKAIVDGTFGHMVAAGDQNKLGGEPDWIQGDETPRCPECREQMEFYGQLDHLGSVEALNDRMIYVFICRDCYTTQAVLQWS
jgi:hypothetical protein